MVFHCLNCRHEQTIGQVIVRKPDPFPKGFISRTSWNSENIRTMNAQNLSVVQVFQWFSHKCKSLFFQSCPKEVFRFLCECILILLRGNLQSIRKHHLTKFQNEVQLFFLETITWKQKMRRSGIRKGVTTYKFINPPVIIHLVRHGAIFSRPCICIEKEFEYTVRYKAGNSKVSTSRKFHVSIRFASEGKKITKSWLPKKTLSRQNSVLFWYQALKLAGFTI